MRSALFFLGLVLALVVPLGLIVQKEHVLASGQSILLELAPRDPRSLMQGDYMVLDYALTRELDALLTTAPHDGVLVLKLDSHGVGTFARMDSSDIPLAPDEHRLRYRVRNGRFRLGAESFFFQEGHAARYQRARYAELKTAASGASVLAGLRDNKRQPLGADSSDNGDTPTDGEVPTDVNAPIDVDAPTDVDASLTTPPPALLPPHSDVDAPTNTGAPTDADAATRVDPPADTP